MRDGMGLTALNDHVSWGLYIANFTFLVGLAAGMLGGLFGVGGGLIIVPGLIGFAAGHGVQNQDLAYEGSSATNGDYAIAEFDYRPEGTQWIVSLLGMVGSWESKTNRGYTSGGSTDSGSGQVECPPQR